MMNDRLLHSRRIGEFALRLSRGLSPQWGKRVACWAAWLLSRNKQSEVYRALLANQAVLGAGKVGLPTLHQYVRTVLQNTGVSYYNLFHNMQSPAVLQDLVIFSPEIEEIIQRSREGHHGMVVAGVHLSNFDLVAQAAAYHGLKAIGLSIPNPDEAVAWQHDLRRQSGLEILDANLSNLRRVIQRLQDGETVVTGVDRPIPEAKIRPLFFGHPAHLAVHHIQLALKARVPLFVMGAVYGDDGKYTIHSTGEIHLQHGQDHQQELLFNAELVLDQASQLISLAPQQWAIFQPVWPDVDISKFMH